MVRRTDGRTDIPTDKDEQSDILVVCTQIAKWTDMDGRTKRHTGGLYPDSKMDWKKKYSGWLGGGGGRFGADIKTSLVHLKLSFGFWH